MSPLRPWTKVSAWARDARLPRRTVRLRLTALYGGLFLISGASLLSITYVLVEHNDSAACIQSSLKGTTISACVAELSGSGPGLASKTNQNGQPTTYSESGGTSAGGTRPGGTNYTFRSGQAHGGPLLITNPPGMSAKQIADQTKELNDLASLDKSNELHTLLTESGIALAIMALLSIALGWLVAGRVLRPLRTITSTVQQISATNLHERLGLEGPDDELKELGDTFDRLLERLDASFQSQKQFVANASHELRTPLARQRTLAQVALSDPEASVESLRAAHERILLSGEQQEQLIDALLTLSRVNGGTNRRESFDLGQIGRELLVVKAAEAELRGLHLDVVLASAPGIGDPRLVERLMVNLLDNAIRHNVDRGGIEVVTGTSDDCASLIVANDGPMIRSEDIDRLFEPFQRLGAERTIGGEGFGLGLCIVRAVAEAEGATITTTPRLEGGLSIEVTFPAFGVDRSQVELSPRPGTGVASDAPADSMRENGLPTRA